jgi:hypothetical protein
MNKRISLALLVLYLAMLACGSSGSTLKTTDDYMREFGGNPDVYNEILAMTDCTALQEKFDIAAANNDRETAGTKQFQWTLGYMQASDNRMREIGCYAPSNSSSNTAKPSIAALIQATSIASSTPFILPTLTKPVNSTVIETQTPATPILFIFPTRPTAIGGSVSGNCSCSGDNLNCIDFSNQPDAQACYDSCVQKGAGDINRLDQDNDGIACENN